MLKIKTEIQEKLAELWDNDNFKELVGLLRLNQENCAKACLTRNNMDEILRLQEEARAYSIVIKTVEDCYNKVNNIKKTRRKKI
jgi:hypothetical protein